MPEEIASNPEPANTTVSPVPETQTPAVAEPVAPVQAEIPAVITPTHDEAYVEPIQTPESTPETLTAQLGGNEPLNPVPTETQQAPQTVEIPEVMNEPAPIENTQPVQTEPVVKEIPELTTTETLPPTQSTTEASPILQVETPASTPVSETTTAQELTPAPVIARTFTKSMRELFTKAQLAIQNRKRKKIDRVMTLFAKQTKITNNEVEKLLHVSDATATRYLNTLENEGKIKQNTKAGKWVSYSKI